jgi:CheY-like chemotaxis protein
VLLIEDDEEVLSATSLLLGKWGCVVTPHTRPPAQKTDCDLIITDFDLADAGTAREGIALVRRAEGRNIPAVIITGHSEEEVRGLIDDDTVPILPKPVRPAKLRSIITAQSLAREGVETESGL